MTLTSVVPSLIDALIAAATTALPNVSVVDGPITKMPEGDYLFVGTDDPALPNFQVSSADQQWASATYTTRNETGSVNCAVSSWSGNSSKEARDAAHAVAGTIQGLLRDKSQFNVPGVWEASYAHGGFSQQPDDFGFLALLVFRIDFKARI